MWMPTHKKFWNYYSEYTKAVPESDRYGTAFERGN